MTIQIKQFIFILITITLVVLLSACSSGGRSATPPPAEDGFEELTSGIDDNGELEAEVDMTITNRLGASSLITQQTNSPQPVILEFRAKTKRDRTFKGVLISASENVNELDFKGMQLKARVLKTSDGTRFMLGTAAVKQSNTKIVWSFIGVGRKKSLTGPLIGTQFMLNGEVQLKAVCNEDSLTGRGILLPSLTGTKVATAFTAFKQATFPCQESTFRDSAGAYTQAEVINTHIGPLLSGQGTLHFDGAMRPMAMYYLGVAVSLSERQEIAGFTGEFKDSVIPVDPFMLAELAEIRPSGTMVFDNAVAGLQRLEVGSILASKPTPRAPHGFMRRVTSIRHRDNKLIVKTEQAHLKELIASGGFNVKRDLGMADLERFIPLQPGVTMTTPSVSQLSLQAVDLLPIAPININVVVIDLDGNHATTNDQVRIEGTLTLNATAEAVFECGFLCTDIFFDSAFVFEETFEVSVIGELGKTVDKTIPLFEMYFLPIPIAPLIALVPRVTIDLQLDGSIQVSFEYHVEQSFTAEAGLTFENGSWSTHRSVSKSFNADDPEVSGSMDAKARVALKGALLLNGIVGMSADVGAYVLLEAQYPGNPNWGLYFGIDSYVYAELDLFVWQQSYPLTKIFDKQWTIVEASGSPPVIQSITIDNHSVNDGHNDPERVIQFAPVFIKVNTYDDQDGASCCTVEYESNLEGDLGSTSNQNVHELEVTFDQVGLQTITLLVTDSSGKPVRETFEIEVIDQFHGSAVSRCFGYTIVEPDVGGIGGISTFTADVTNWGDVSGCEFIFDPATAEYDVFWYLDGAYVGQGKITDSKQQDKQKIDFGFNSTGIFIVEAHAIDATDGGIAGTVSIAYEVQVDELQQNQGFSLNASMGTVGSTSGSSPLRYDNLSVEESIHFDLQGSQSNNCCDITWSSDVDGSLGVNTPIEMDFDSSGWRTITATVIDRETGASKEISQDIFVNESSVFEDGYISNDITCQHCP